jgi:hypothetical protein
VASAVRAKHVRFSIVVDRGDLCEYLWLIRRHVGLGDWTKYVVHLVTPMKVRETKGRARARLSGVPNVRNPTNCKNRWMWLAFHAVRIDCSMSERA